MFNVRQWDRHFGWEQNTNENTETLISDTFHPASWQCTPTRVSTNRGLPVEVLLGGFCVIHRTVSLLTQVTTACRDHYKEILLSADFNRILRSGFRHRTPSSSGWLQQAGVGPAIVCVSICRANVWICDFRVNYNFECVWCYKCVK